MNGGEPARITVNLTPRAVAARDAASTRTGDNLTDTINRALAVYALLVDRYGLTEPDGLTVIHPDCVRERLYLT